MFELKYYMKINFQNVAVYNTPIKYTLKNTRNPLDLYKMMSLYSHERKESFPHLRVLFYTIDTIFHNCKMRVAKDSFGKIIAAYTYRLRKNRLDEKSFYVDALVRNLQHNESKNLMPVIYRDMKAMAQRKKAKELTLFSGVLDKNLRKKYERLGFQKDERVYVYGGYIMRTKIDKFLQNA